MSSNLLVSIIIPTKNEEKNIGRLIKSINESSGFNTDIIEIIVVDNPGTTDKTSEIAKLLGAKVYSQGPERSAQRNRGAEEAAGQYIYFVDADMEFSTDLLTEILESIQNNDSDIGFIVPERIPGDSIYCRAMNIEKQIYDGNDKISACRVFSKDSFTKVGGYDPELIMGEDWDLDKRLRTNGLKVHHLKNWVWHHEANLGFWGSVQKKLYYAKNLKKYKVGVQTQVNPLYRYGILFSKPVLFFKDPLAFLYLVCLKTVQFGLGAITIIISKIKK